MYLNAYAHPMHRGWYPDRSSGQGLGLLATDHHAEGHADLATGRLFFVRDRVAGEFFRHRLARAFLGRFRRPVSRHDRASLAKVVGPSNTLNFLAQSFKPGARYQLS